MQSVLGDPALERLLDGLHTASKAEEEAVDRYFFHERTGPWLGMEPRDHAFMADKMIALERQKGEFCYMMCRATGAQRVVEAGTSFGVSTLYLAAAMRDNGGGTVFASEYEPVKAGQARSNFQLSGLGGFIEFHEADIIEACAMFEGPIDFVLFDIWGQVVRPVLDILLPRLRPGAVICADGERSDGYAGLCEVLDDPAQGFRTMSVPFEGGLVFSLKL